MYPPPPRVRGTVAAVEQRRGVRLLWLEFPPEPGVRLLAAPALPGLFGFELLHPLLRLPQLVLQPLSCFRVATDGVTAMEAQRTRHLCR